MEYSIIFSYIINMPSSWEVILELMEGAGHDSICEIESFLNTIAMMNINIDVKYPLEDFQ